MFRFSPVPSCTVYFWAQKLYYKWKWGERRELQLVARFARKNANIFISYLEFLNFFRFGDFPFGNAGVEKWGCDRDTQSFGSHPGIPSFRIDVNFIEGPDKQHQQMLRIVR